MTNTGYKAYTTLEQYNVYSGNATGVTKPNTVGDADYVAPVLDEVYCPIESTINWIAGGFYNSSEENVLKSTDGINWDYSRIPTLFDIYDISFVNGEWFAVGASQDNVGGGFNNKVMRSFDTITWAEAVIPQISSVQSINYANGIYVATGRADSSGLNTIATSVDGVNWTGRGIGGLDINSMGVTFANGIWVAYGESDAPDRGSLAYSTDAINWTPTFNYYYDKGFTFGYDAFYNGSYWISTGLKGGSNTNVVGKSSDGINWTPYSTGATVDNTGRRLGYFNNLWVLGGKGSFEIATSTNGQSWTGRLNQDLIDIRDFEYNDNKIISVGGKSESVGKIYSSTNATTWTELAQTRLGLYTIAIRK